MIQINAAARLHAFSTVQPNEEADDEGVRPLEPEEDKEIENGAEPCKLEAAARLAAMK